MRTFGSDGLPLGGGSYEPAGSVATHAALAQTHGITAFGATLVDDVDAAAARATLVLGTAAVEAASAFATAGHNHDASYSALAHDHDADYSALGHNHDASYSALGHNHDASYAALGHGHAQLHDRSHALTSASDHTAGNWKLFHSNGAGQLVELALGTSGHVLTAQGASAAPIFAAPAGGGGGATAGAAAITTTTSSSNSVWSAITGSPVTMVAGRTYRIRWLLRTYAAAATTGLGLRRVLAGGAVGTVLGFHYSGMSSATAAIVQSSREGTIDQFIGTGNATSSTTVAGSYVAECVFVCTTGGTLGLEMRSEVNASLVTVDGDGSYVTWVDWAT